MLWLRLCWRISVAVVMRHAWWTALSWPTRLYVFPALTQTHAIRSRLAAAPLRGSPAVPAALQVRLTRTHMHFAIAMCSLFNMLLTNVGHPATSGCALGSKDIFAAGAVPSLAAPGLSTWHVVPGRVSQCAHSHDGDLFAAEGDIRLANSVNAADGGAEYGRLEVFHSGGWGTVCDNAFMTQFIRDIVFVPAAADVACRQLGYQQGFQIQTLV